MTNIINILNNTNEKSLILLDELCSGTDPSEGAVLSIALLDKFKELNATMLCTTHYPEIKNYCFESEYYKNSSMEFDFEKLNRHIDLLSVYQVNQMQLIFLQN